MRFFLFFVPFLNFCLSISIIIFLYKISLNPQALMWFYEEMSKILDLSMGGYYLAGAAAVLLLIDLEYLILKIRKRNKSQYIILKYPNGHVSIAVKGLEEFVHKICKGFPEIKELSSKVISCGKKVVIFLNVQLLAGYNATNVAEELQRNIKSQIQNILGLEKIVDVDMKVIEVQEENIEVFQDKMFQDIGSQ